MKKAICVIFCILMLSMGLIGCMNDNEYEKLQQEYYAGKTAVIYLDNNLIVEGKLERLGRGSYGTWTLRINGKEYSTHCSNVVIIDDISKGENNNADN